MNRPDVRYFTLNDAIILVAAAALIFGGIRAEMTRHFHPYVNYHEIGFRPTPAAGDSTSGTSWSATSFKSPWFERVQHWAGSTRLAAPCLASLSPALLLIRWSRPRPSWPRLIRQYGAVASLSATLALGISLAHALGKLLDETLHPTILFIRGGAECSRFSFLVCQAIRAADRPGWSVLIAWLVLSLSGRRWRAREPRLARSGRGRAVGVGLGNPASRSSGSS